MKIIWALLILGVLGLVLGFILALFAKIFYVKPDTRVEDIKNILPGYNCGGCGKPGCNALAEAIVHENADPSLCKPGKASNVNQKIKEYLEKNK